MPSEFTERFKNIITHFAREEAYRLHHNYIGPEHIFLAIIHKGTGVATETIQRMNINLDTLQLEVENLAKTTVVKDPFGDIRYTPRSHKVIDFTREEAKLLNHTYVGTEHLLLGLIREGEGIPAKVLANHGITLELARSQMVEVLSGSEKNLNEIHEKKVKKIIHNWFQINEDLLLILPSFDYDNKLFNLVDRNREYLREWLPWLDNNKSINDTLRFINECYARYDKDLGLDLGILYQENLVGMISLFGMDWIHRKTSLGYWLAKDYQGKGIMTASCRILIDYAFTELKLNRIEIRCATENKKSRAIPERLGFKEEGVIRQNEWLYDHFVNHAVYGLLSSEWKTSI